MASKPFSCSEIGVSVKDVSLHYSGNSKPTLVNMNMNIPKGAIYGLLGPSGCGKTSILRCILGRNRPKSGEIRVFGFRPGTKESQIPGPGVGYMPQDIALYNEFSIEETINYFATIFSLSHEVKKSRLQNLLKFLDLPDKNRLVKNLSGGQKRRVSMAATLVHKPKLLILDEPTVGVDPLLRESIWQHLYELTQAEKMTIIITTHYIEEARLAHVIGLMRQGTLLVEENPQSLMVRYACTNLEEVFLKICHLQKQPEVQIENECSSLESNNNNNNNNHDRPLEDEHHPLVDPIESLTVNSHQSHHHQSFLSSIPILSSNVEPINGISSTQSNANSLLKQEVLQQRLLNIYNDTTYRKRKSSSWSSIVPQFKVFRESNNGHVSFCLDHFNKACSQVRKSIVKTQRNLGLITFQLLLPTITMIFFCLCIGNSPSGLNLAVYNEEVNLYNYSHDFIDKLDPKVFNLHFYSSEEEAIESVREGSNWGALIVNANYSYGLKDRLENFYQISNDSLASSIIKYYSDQTEMPIQLAIGKGLLSAGLDYVGTVMQKILPEIQPEVISSPMFERMPPIYGQLDPSFRDYVAPALVLAVTYAMSVGLTALAFVQERKEGLFERSLVSGVNTVHIFFAHFIVEFCMVLIQTLVMLFFMFVVFKVPIYGSVWLAVALTLAQGMCGMSFGMLISSICQDERNAIMLTIGMFYPTLVLTGIIWPIEAMPKHMLYFVLPLPQTLSVKAMRAIITKAWDFWHPEVNFGFASTFAWILIFNMAALIIFSRR